MHRWRDVGDLVVPRQLLDVWANEKDAKARCTAVLSHWLDHPPRHYPATWEGLYELLDDSELGQVATELKQLSTMPSKSHTISRYITVLYHAYIECVVTCMIHVLHGKHNTTRIVICNIDNNNYYFQLFSQPVMVTLTLIPQVSVYEKF